MKYFKMTAFHGILLASVTAAAADVVVNGGFETEQKNVSAGIVQSMKKQNWKISEPLRLPAGWTPNGYIKQGMVKYPDSPAAEGKTAFTFRGTMRCTKFTSLKGLQNKLTVKFASKGGPGFVGVYLYSKQYAFLSEMQKSFTASAEWKEQTIEFTIPKDSRNKPVENICLCFGSSGEKEISLDRVSAQIPAVPVVKKPAIQKPGMDTITFKDTTIKSNKSQVFSFKQADNDTRQIRFCMDVRIVWNSLGGYAPAMEVRINGERIRGKCLLNKPLQFRTRSGGKSLWANPEGTSYVVMYSSDFSDEIQTNEAYVYGLYEKNQQPYRFVFDLTGKTKHVGENKVEVYCAWQTLALQNICVEFDKEFLPRINDYKAQGVAPAPKGKLPDLSVKGFKNVPLTVTNAKGKSFVAACSGFALPVETRISAPNGKWVTAPGTANGMMQVWKTPEYMLTRKMVPGTNRIRIFDTFTNLKEKPVGVIVENKIILPKTTKRVLVSGRELVLKRFSAPSGNPTIIGEMGKDCFGIVLEDDLFRSQGEVLKTDKEITLSDPRLAIPAKGSHTLEWSIYYGKDADYYDLINEIRKDWKVNFTLNGPFSFPYGGGTPGISVNYWNKADQAKVADFLNKRKVKTIITHVPGNYSIPQNKSTREKPYLGHGTALQDAGFASWRNQTRGMTAALKQFAPDVKVHCYIHKNLCSEQGNRTKYPECIAQDSTYQKLSEGVCAYYVPTAKNAYGKKLAETYRYMVDNLGTNIYMDEICLGVTAAGKYPEWDQCTGIINPMTHELTDTVSLPNLLEREWMNDMMAYLRSKERLLIGNAPPVTKALRDFHAVFFTEECMGESGLFSMHLSTPLGFCYGLGKSGFTHLRKTLEQGVVCFQYSGEWNQYCFPLTPMEVRPGYIIAEERIITIKSGSFGWNDESNAEIHVYNAEGKEVSGMSATKKVNGKNFFEIRMPGDHIAFIIRKK